MATKTKLNIYHQEMQTFYLKKIVELLEKEKTAINNNSSEGSTDLNDPEAMNKLLTAIEKK